MQVTELKSRLPCVQGRETDSRYARRHQLYLPQQVIFATVIWYNTWLAGGGGFGTAATLPTPTLARPDPMLAPTPGTFTGTPAVGVGAAGPPAGVDCGVPMLTETPPRAYGLGRPSG